MRSNACEDARHPVVTETIPDEVYQSFFVLPFTRGIVQENQLKYLVYDIPKEVILKWQT